jgi:hypothetical protein
MRFLGGKMRSKAFFIRWPGDLSTYEFFVCSQAHFRGEMFWVRYNPVGYPIHHKNQSTNDMNAHEKPEWKNRSNEWPVCLSVHRLLSSL